MSYFREKSKTSKSFEWRSREISTKLNVHSLYEVRSCMSDGSVYRYKPFLIYLIERWDYVHLFKWSIRTPSKGGST